MIGALRYDTFIFESGIGTLFDGIMIDGGVGTDRVDYSAWSAGVTVDLGGRKDADG